MTQRQDNALPRRGVSLTHFITRDRIMKRRVLFALAVIGVFATLALFARAADPKGGLVRRRVGRFEAGFHIFKWTYEDGGTEKSLNVGYPMGLHGSVYSRTMT